MLDVTKYPPSAHGVRALSGSVVLWAYSRAQELENISLPFSSLAEIVEVRGRVAIFDPSGVSPSLNRTVTCFMCPCHDEFRGPRSDYVRQVALATTTTTTLMYIHF
ncbi:hypothetical protein TNCV_3612431 [Trichonephila clavipes]|nr:hypothetical protein TNCV_3612431 [Trichonephila clavipes]